MENKIAEIEKHIKSIMDILGIEETDSTIGTPKRVAKMYVNDIFKSLNPGSLEELNNSITTFSLNKKPEISLYDSDIFEEINNRNEMIIVKDIDFYSTCEHHFMPFFGKIAVGYVPNDEIIGLSKIPRVVKHFSKLPQLQERLGDSIVDYLITTINPKLVVVKIYDTEHTCCSARGIETKGVTNTIHIKVGDKSLTPEQYNYYLNHFRNEVN